MQFTAVCTEKYLLDTTRGSLLFTKYKAQVKACIKCVCVPENNSYISSLFDYLNMSP